jgi:hypothetical protein
MGHNTYCAVWVGHFLSTAELAGFPFSCPVTVSIITATMSQFQQPVQNEVPMRMELLRYCFHSKGLVAGSCDDSNELPGSITRGGMWEFFDKLRDYYLLKIVSAPWSLVQSVFQTHSLLRVLRLSRRHITEDELRRSLRFFIFLLSLNVNLLQTQNSTSPRPDRLWAPPSLLSKGYQGLFPCG